MFLLVLFNSFFFFFFSFHHCAKKTLLINEASNPEIGSIPLPQAMKEPQGVVCYWRKPVHQSKSLSGKEPPSFLFLHLIKTRDRVSKLNPGKYLTEAHGDTNINWNNKLCVDVTWELQNGTWTAHLRWRILVHFVCIECNNHFLLYMFIHEFMNEIFSYQWWFGYEGLVKNKYFSQTPTKIEVLCTKYDLI